MRYLIVLVLCTFLLVSCSPSEVVDSQIQTAIAQTQQAFAASDLARLQTEVAVTQAALATIDASQKQTQAIMAQTQAAGPSLEQQIQAALAQTQQALLDDQLAQQATQTVQALTTTPTPPPPQVDFSDAFVYSVGHFSRKESFITIKLSKPFDKDFKGKYHAEIVDKKYLCSILEDYPDRLFCKGPHIEGGFHLVVLYEDYEGGANVVWSGSFTLPENTATRVPTPTPTQD